LSEDGRTENLDRSVFITKDKPAKPLARFLGAPLPVKHRHVFTPTDNAEKVYVSRQIPGQLAVCELVAGLDLIHGARQIAGKILDEIAVFAFVRIFHKVAPKEIGYGLYFLIRFFNNIHARLSANS
jgi:hypothetical protein